MRDKKNSNIEGFCPVQRSLEIIGTPWKFLIINSLMDNGILRFGELRKSIDGISEKMLSQSLKQLEEDNLVIRKEATDGSNKVEYFLTKEAEDLDPILRSIKDWGNKYLKNNQ